MKKFLVDTGYLIALYDSSDDALRVQQARRSFRSLFQVEANSLIIMWPVLYETLNTRLSKRIDIVEQIDRDWTKMGATKQIQYVEDAGFRERALLEWRAELRRGRHYRPLSLVDRVLRNAILSPLKLNALLTFNPGDFQDVCSVKGISIFPQH